MKRQTRLITILTLILFGLATQTGWADDLDDLSELSDNAAEQQGSDGSGLEALGDSGGSSLEALGDSGGDDLVSMVAEETSMPELVEESGLKISFGGYIKLLGYWNKEQYSDLLWNRVFLRNFLLDKGATYSMPPAREVSGFNNAGTRLQLKIEGYLGQDARLFTAFNVNYNTTGSIHDRNATLNNPEKQNAEVRLVEAFVEIYEGSRIWKVGPQLVTWSYLEGMEVPTDRVNARDNSYKSTEYEDSKLPSTGVLLTQKLGSFTRFEVMAIPVAKTNIGMPFQDYLYAGDDQAVEPKPNRTKWATRFSGTIGKLDLAVSYVEGLDPNADIYVSKTITVTPALMPPSGGTVNAYGKTYNHIKSPGLDLQYNLGSWLAKLSYVNTITEDDDGTDPLIKNTWSKYVIGGEFTIGGSTINIYAGQHLIEDFDEDSNTNMLVGQIRERTDFVSGHMNADFLTGNALNLVLMAANYWDDEGESVQTMARATFNYKIADGLNFLVGTSYMNMMENDFTDIQTEVKYSF